MANNYDLSDYDKHINALSQAANNDLEKLLAQRYSFSDAAKYREWMNQQVSELSRKYEESASTVAADNYNSWRKQLLGKTTETELAEFDAKKAKNQIQDKTHSFKDAENGKISGNDALDMSREQLQVMLDRRMRNAARSTMLLNSRKDKEGIGCASVPSGPTPCPFCLQMACIGVAYSFKVLDVEGRALHDHCHCRFIPGFLGTHINIDGFNPDAISDALQDVYRTLGLPANTLPTDSEHIAYIVRQELERRDPNWIMTGEPAPVEYIKPVSKLTDREKETAMLLSNGHGITHIWLYEDVAAPANIDLLINGNYWEEKSPSNNSRSSVFENLANATSKWRRLSLNEPIRIVYSNRFGTRSDATVFNEIKSMMNELNISEILFINSDGSLHRYTM